MLLMFLDSLVCQDLKQHTGNTGKGEHSCFACLEEAVVLQVFFIIFISQF